MRFVTSSMASFVACAGTDSRRGIGVALASSASASEANTKEKRAMANR